MNDPERIGYSLPEGMLEKTGIQQAAELNKMACTDSNQDRVAFAIEEIQDVLFKLKRVRVSASSRSISEFESHARELGQEAIHTLQGMSEDLDKANEEYHSETRECAYCGCDFTPGEENQAMCTNCIDDIC